MRNKTRLLSMVLALTVMLMIPTIATADEECGGQMINAWEILVDMSGSMDAGWRSSDCAAMQKFAAQKGLLKKMNEAIPDYSYQGALRIFGFKQYNFIEPDDWSKLVWGPGPFDRGAAGAAISELRQEIPRAITPLGRAIMHSDGEFSAWEGYKALIVMSDFNRISADFGDPVGEVNKLKEKYGDNIVVYTIGFGFTPDELEMAQAVAEAGGGRYFDGCLVTRDQAAFDAMIREIFRTDCPDEDCDGVCDDLDQCPGTPRGAEVDERGCWIGAYDAFFDFDKAIIKSQYMPLIERNAKILVAHPELYVTLDGHTDSVGSEQYNYGLGLRRAKAVERAMVRYGVKRGRLRVKSYGETRPIADNETDEGRAKNRRVEITIWQPGAK